MTRSHARHQRRKRLGRLDHLICELIKTRGDHCGVCGRPLIDRALTFYGLRYNALVISASCCRHKLEDIYAGGIYIAKYDREAS